MREAILAGHEVKVAGRLTMLRAAVRGYEARCAREDYCARTARIPGRRAAAQADR